MQHSKQLVKYLFVVICCVSGTIFSAHNGPVLRCPIPRKSGEQAREFRSTSPSPNPLHVGSCVEQLPQTRKELDAQLAALGESLRRSAPTKPIAMPPKNGSFGSDSRFGSNGSMSPLTPQSSCLWPITPPNRAPLTGSWERQSY